LLASNGFIVDVLKTEHKGHAAEFIKKEKFSSLKQYYAILCFSGDGVIHELMNGFYARNDYNELNLRIAPLVCGGGKNSMTLNSLKEWNYEKTLLNCLYVLTKAKFRDVTVTKYLTNGKSNVIYGCVGYMFGYYSDVDLNSDFLKFLYNWKYEVYGFMKLFNLNRRKAKIYYSEKSLKEQTNDDCKKLLDDKSYLNDWECKDESFYNFLYLTSPEWTGKENISCNRTFEKSGSGFGEMVMNTSADGYIAFLKTLIKIGEKGDGLNEGECKKIKSFRMELEDLKEWNMENTPVQIDGEVYDGTIVQGTVLDGNCRVKLIA